MRGMVHLVVSWDPDPSVCWRTSGGVNIHLVWQGVTAVEFNFQDRFERLLFFLVRVGLQLGRAVLRAWRLIYFSETDLVKSLFFI